MGEKLVVFCHKMGKTNHYTTAEGFMRKRLKILCIALTVVILLAAAYMAKAPLKAYLEENAQYGDYMDKDRQAYAEELLTTKHRLSLHEDGTFTVLILSDMHCEGADTADEIIANIKELVIQEQPSLVIFTGDNTQEMRTKSALKKCIARLVAYIESRSIPWAHIYGNHDDEGLFVLSREAQQRVYESFDYCVSKEGENLRGVGSYVLPVFMHDSDQLAFNIWCLDSGTYQDKNQNPDFIKKEQIEWYRYASGLLSDYNGSTVPAIMTFHIPLPENAQAFQQYEDAGLPYEGSKNEQICYPIWNSGMFSNVVEQGDVQIIVTAHDHCNDYAVEMDGVMLCASATIGTSGSTYYNSENAGARVVKFDLQSQKQFTTYMSYLNP